jgi:urocanate hydratase
VPESRTQSANSYKPIRAPRGPGLSCKGWQQEAALRLLMNSLDPAIAEHPEELIISSGVGKLARDWPAFHAIVNSLQALENDETFVIRGGTPGPVLKTNPEAPRVLVSNSTLSSIHSHSDKINAAMPTRATRMAANWMFTGPSSALPEAYKVFRAAARKHFGGSLAGRLVVAGGMGGMGGAQPLAATLNGAAFLGIDADTASIKRRVKSGYCEAMVNNIDEALRILKNAVRKREPASVGLIGNASELLPEFVSRGVLPDLLTDQTPADDLLAYIPQGLTTLQAAEARVRDPRAYRERALDSIAAQARAMLELRKIGAIAFEFGNGLRAHAFARGVSDAYEIPDFASEYLQADLGEGRGLLTVMALSGDPDDLARVDDLFPELFPDEEHLREWITMARKHPSQGLPARSFWMNPSQAIKLGTAINDLATRGELKAPVAIGRSIRPHSSKNPIRNQLPLGSDDPGKPWPHALEDSAELAAFLRAASGAAWLSGQEIAGPNETPEQRWSLVVLADGKRETAHAIARLFTTGPADLAF